MPEQPTHTFFNSRCAECKTPFGAVPAGQTVTWRLTVPERLGYVDPHLVLTKDREDPVHYRMNFDGQTPGVNHFVFQLAPTTSGLYFYHFDLYTDFRKIYRTANGEGELTWVNGLDWQLTVYEPDFKTPDWIKDGTMYQIFPDRFYEGVPNKPLPFADRIYRPDKTGEPYFWPNEQSDGYLNMDYYGGDFAGIQQKLPYLEELGVTCIYLNPIFEAHANHRYNTANYLKADPLLGTNEDFAALCAEAKKHGIRIILDGVFSHTGSDSLYFNREGRYGPGGAYRDRNSPYRSWYDFDPGYVGGYRSWWGFETLPEVNERINELLKQSIKSDGVINLFSDVNTEFSLFDPKFLEEISKMKEKNLAVELLKKLIAEQVSIYRRTNVVKSEKFSEIMQRAMNSYLNGMLTNEQVIEEMMKLAKQIAAAQKEGEKLGLTADELAFYDALTKPQAIKDFYENEELIAITKELAETLRKNRTIDWQKRDSARAKMRMMIKKLLKKHKYPPEGMDDAVQTVMTQCELWTDNADFS